MGVNATQLAELHGVTRETIRQWTVAGCPRRQDGSYVVAETITWRIQRELEKDKKTRAPQGDEPKLTEMNRKLRAEAVRPAAAHRCRERGLARSSLLPARPRPDAARAP